MTRPTKKTSGNSASQKLSAEDKSKSTAVAKKSPVTNKVAAKPAPKTTGSSTAAKPETPAKKEVAKKATSKVETKKQVADQISAFSKSRVWPD